MKSDFEIQQAVVAELQWEPALNASEIGVSVKQGIVMLSGIVDNYYKKVMAEKLAKKVIGVKAVAEEIEVKPAGTKLKNDADIAAAVIHALKWNSAVDEDQIKVIVEKGCLTLEGETEWNFQKVSAQKAVENITGITRIINNLRVKNKVTVDNVKQKIAMAFLRHATLDADQVKVEVIGDKVILTGKVRSFAEKQDAERTVWSSPGVMSIDNRLVIDSQIVMY